MKNLFLLLFLAFGLGLCSYSQETLSPKIIRKAYYADKTPPLREMTIILPGEHLLFMKTFKRQPAFWAVVDR